MQEPIPKKKVQGPIIYLSQEREKTTYFNLKIHFGKIVFEKIYVFSY